MNPNSLKDLTYEQRMAMALSMHIRNELEEFHCDHVPDNIMPELNSTIRYAIHDFFENVVSNQKKLGWLVMMIPDYWEVPGRDPKPMFTGEYLWEGKPFPKSDADASTEDETPTDGKA